MPNLADLISARKAERGWSYAQLAERANDAVSRQRWQQLGTGTRIKEFPEPATIQAIADALDVDITLVVLAVARSIGFDVSKRDSSLAAMLPPSAAHLSPEQRDAVLAVVRVMAPPTGVTDENQGAKSATDDPPTGGGVGRPTTTTGAADRGNVTPLIRPDEGGELETKRAASDRIIETEDNTPGE